MRVNCLGNGYREMFTSFNGNVHVERAARLVRMELNSDRTLVYSSITVRRRTHAPLKQRHFSHFPSRKSSGTLF